MREITSNLDKELESHIGSNSLDKSAAFPVNSYQRLVAIIAKLAFLNKDHLLFFRGQDRDYRSKAGSTTIYPKIYRGDYLPQREINYRFELLHEASKQLKHLFTIEEVDGFKELSRKKYIQWSILQHYEVCATPFLDITHSIRVACSFAQHFSKHSNAYVYTFGLPYITHRITINSEHDLVLIRLLSICPPDALRPYFQEGYLTGTEDITIEYDSKTELDFKNRLIAKFEIPNNDSFWKPGFSAIPKNVLFPSSDRVKDLCTSIKLKIKNELMPGQIGEFIQLWTKLESDLISRARYYDSDIFTLRSAINQLVESDQISTDSLMTFEGLRKFRNILVHEPKKVSPEELLKYINTIDGFSRAFKNQNRNNIPNSKNDHYEEE